MSQKRKRRPHSEHGTRRVARDVKNDALAETGDTPQRSNRQAREEAKEHNNASPTSPTGTSGGDVPVSMLELKVTNLAIAKHDFFASGCNVAPTFTYDNDISKITEQVLGNRNVNFSLLQEAKRIMRKSKEVYGDFTSFKEHCYGMETCSNAHLYGQVQSYLKKHNLDHLADVNVDDTMLAVANVTQPNPKSNFLINVCAAQATCGMIQSICDHEIGTHLLRIINDEKQPWHKRRNKYRLSDPSSMYITEEGLATLNTVRALPCKLLHFYAVRYYAVCYGAKLGFVELFNDLRSHNIDSEDCWQICCRIKRGLLDTSLPGAFWKDQSYLQGAVEILQHLEAIAFHHDKAALMMKHLYSGRIAVSDLRVVRCVVDNSCITMPHFLRTSKVLKAWLCHCRDLIQENDLADICSSVQPAPRSESAPPRVSERRMEEDDEDEKGEAESMKAAHSAQGEIPTRVSVRRPSIERPSNIRATAEVSLPNRMSRHSAPEEDQAVLSKICLGEIKFQGASSDSKPNIEEGVTTRLSIKSVRRDSRRRSRSVPRESIHEYDHGYSSKCSSNEEVTKLDSRRRARSAPRRSIHEYNHGYSSKCSSNEQVTKLTKPKSQSRQVEASEQVMDIWEFLEAEPTSDRKNPIARSRQQKIGNALRTLVSPFWPKEDKKIDRKVIADGSLADVSNYKTSIKSQPNVQRSKQMCFCVIC